jgi:hypothetical protein
MEHEAIVVSGRFCPFVHAKSRTDELTEALNGLVGVVSQKKPSYQVASFVEVDERSKFVKSS